MEINCEGNKHLFVVSSFFEHINYSGLAPGAACVCGKKKIAMEVCECGSTVKKIVDVGLGNVVAANTDYFQ